MIKFLETAEEMMKKELNDYLSIAELSSQVKLQIVNKRIDNGLIFTKLTKKLLEEIKNDNKDLIKIGNIVLK